MATIDISDLLASDGSVPIPNWDLVALRVNSLPEEDRSAGWTSATRQWLNGMQQVYGEGFAVYESDDFQILTVRDPEFSRFILANARHCRETLIELLSEIGKFDGPGKEVVLCFPSGDFYYDYVSAYHEEGDFGGSVGMHIRSGYSHIVINGVETSTLTATLAHELTHATLQVLGSPLWLEEGITQFVERIASGMGRPDLTTDDLRAMRRYWAKRSLEEFWTGQGFSMQGNVQKYSYQLADILMNILIEEHRPGILGFGKKKRERLVAFVRTARAADAGMEAAQEHLGYRLGALAAKSLGPGEWDPRIV